MRARGPPDVLTREEREHDPRGIPLPDRCSTLPGMSWTRGPLALLAVCVLLLSGSAGCGTGAAHEGKNGESASPGGRLLDRTDTEGRRLREVDGPDVRA